MKRQITYVITALLAATVISAAATPDKDAVMAKEKAAWQAYKDKKADDFKKLIDKDLRCVYAEGVKNRQDELDDMQKWDMKSFTFSDFDSFSDEPDVIVTTYKVAIEGTYNGKDMSGTYNCGSVWKKEKGAWLAIFHAGSKAAEATAGAQPMATP
jgi:hypothetical protein